MRVFCGKKYPGMDRSGPERAAASRRNTGRAWNSVRDKRVTGGQDDGFSKKTGTRGRNCPGVADFSVEVRHAGCAGRTCAFCSAPASGSRESPGGV